MTQIVGSEWWRGAVIYQIYPRSFMDSNGNGIGDLPGITEKLDYVASLGVDAIWLSPFFTSPMKDYGYDVADFCDVDPLFGNLDDFKALLKKSHELDMKVIVDLVCSHTSDAHAWFEESRQSRDNDKADWYVWADPKADGTPPNNWQAHFGGSSWTYEVRRGQYYFHNFLSEQPDLNLRNPGCRQAVFDAARFWLDMGVDGFRLDAARHYFHNEALTDNPPNPAPSSSWFDHPTPFTMQEHINDIHIPDSITFMEDFRTVLDEYDDRMAVAEIGGESGSLLSAKYTDGPTRIHTAYNFSLISAEKPSASFIRDSVMEFLDYPGDSWPSWAFSNHDVIRVASRWHLDKNGYNETPALSKLLIAVLNSLQGSIFMYQGEELGLPEVTIPYEKIQDPFGIFLYPHWQGRDGCRTPMPWAKDAAHAGFSSGDDTWLPIPETHQQLAVDAQDSDENSALAFTRKFLQWRKDQPALITGDSEFVDCGSDDFLCLIRRHPDQSIGCVFNFSDSAQEIAINTPVHSTLSLGIGEKEGTLDGQIAKLPAYGFAYFSVSSEAS